MQTPGGQSKRNRRGNRERPDIERLFEEHVEIDRALGLAVMDALRVHQRLGHRVAIWRDGKVVEIDARELKLDDPAA